MSKALRHLVLAIGLLTLAASTALAGALPDFTDLAAKTGPSVVNISTKAAPQPKAERKLPNQGPRGKNPMEDFFRDFFGDRMPQRRPQASLGSGFVISEDGYIVTNNHVVENASQIEVALQGDGKKTYPAKVIGTDPETDVALIKIEPDTKLHALTFGDSDKSKVGEWVVAIGNPFGLDHSVTAGIISAKGRVIGAGPYDNFIQTDASINPGNSGGPLLNMQGEVIGINTAIIASGQGLGFAVPSSTAKEVLEQLRHGGEVKRGLLGVRIQDLDAGTAKALGLSSAKGALVASVNAGGPAAEAGIKQGDVITTVNGQSVADSRELTRVIGAFAPGTKVNLKAMREGHEKAFQVTLTRRTAEALGQPEHPDEQQAQAQLGMALRSLTEQEAQALDLKTGEGVLVSDLEEGSLAEERGIQPGDVVLEINQRPVGSPEAFRKVLDEDAKKKGAALLLILRRGQNLFVTIPLDK